LELYFCSYLVPYHAHYCNVAETNKKTTIACFIAFQVVNEPTDAHCPVVEMTTRSKLSCLSWNKYAKNQIASSDYEGIVTVWDVATRKVILNSNGQFFLYHLFGWVSYFTEIVLTVIYSLCSSEFFLMTITFLW
jgi:WD40 repeat protein